MSHPSPEFDAERRAAETLIQGCEKIRAELAKVIVGQEEAVEQLLIALFAGGHGLLTGAPGLAKTLLVRSLASVLHLEFQRIQFTPDLMPADITGTEILQDSGDGGRELRFVRGPVFANVVLADEINRTPPKTQAALLECMQERQVTVAGKRYTLDAPFFVLATQNPIEMEGTYPLPEAQLDRFMLNVVLDYLPEDEEVDVIVRTTSTTPPTLETALTGEEVIACHALVRKVPIAESLVRYCVQLAAASRPNRTGSPEFIDRWVSWGAGTRAAQFLVLGAKARALIHGRTHATLEDVRRLVHCTFRHRILVGYRAEAEGITVEQVIDRLLESLPAPGAAE